MVKLWTNLTLKWSTVMPIGAANRDWTVVVDSVAEDAVQSGLGLTMAMCRFGLTWAS